MRQGNQFAEADLARELAELTRAANRANATIYTIDPRGLVGGPDLDEQIDPVEYQNYVRISQDSLRVLAEETGGIAVVNQNDFDKALKRIDNETSDYYVLGYYSTNPDPLKRTRRIDVKVNRLESDRMVTADVHAEAESRPRQTSKPYEWKGRSKDRTALSITRPSSAYQRNLIPSCMSRGPNSVLLAAVGSRKPVFSVSVDRRQVGGRVVARARAVVADRAERGVVHRVEEVERLPQQHELPAVRRG